MHSFALAYLDLGMCGCPWLTNPDASRLANIPAQEIRGRLWVNRRLSAQVAVRSIDPAIDLQGAFLILIVGIASAVMMGTSNQKAEVAKIMLYAMSGESPHAHHMCRHFGKILDA